MLEVQKVARWIRKRRFWEEKDSTRVKWMGLDRQAERRTHRYAKKKC